MEKNIPTPELTQQEADELIQMPKITENLNKISYPGLGGALEAPLISANKREKFRLTMVRGRINLEKASYQNMGRKTIILVRVDIDGPPHRNPDDEEVSCPHIHLYRAGWDDKWAAPLDNSKFSDITDLWQTLHDFMDFCNVVQKPNIERTLGA